MDGFIFFYMSQHFLMQFVCESEQFVHFLTRFNVFGNLRIPLLSLAQPLIVLAQQFLTFRQQLSLVIQRKGLLVDLVLDLSVVGLLVSLGPILGLNLSSHRSLR